MRLIIIREYLADLAREIGHWWFDAADWIDPEPFQFRGELTEEDRL